jgi:hypothetical protein
MQRFQDGFSSVEANSPSCFRSRNLWNSSVSTNSQANCISEEAIIIKEKLIVQVTEII